MLSAFFREININGFKQNELQTDITSKLLNAQNKCLTSFVYIPLLHAAVYKLHYTNCYFKEREKPLSDFELVVASFYPVIIYLKKL